MLDLRSYARAFKDYEGAGLLRPSTAPGATGEWRGLLLALLVFGLTVWVYSLAR